MNPTRHSGSRFHYFGEGYKKHLDYKGQIRRIEFQISKEGMNHKDKLFWIERDILTSSYFKMSNYGDP